MRTLSLRALRQFFRRGFGAVLVLTAAAVADLDVTAALAPLATENRYTRPHFSDSGEMRIAAGRHPGVAIATSSDFGIDIDAKEATASAILGHQTLATPPGESPLGDRGRRGVVLGKITP